MVGVSLEGIRFRCLELEGGVMGFVFSRILDIDVFAV